MKRGKLFAATALSFVSAIVACATDEPAIGFDAPEGGALGDAGMADATRPDACAGEACTPLPRDCSKLDACLVEAPIDRSISLKAVSARSPQDVWMVGTHGTILHRDATGFTRMSSGSDAVLVAVTVAGAGLSSDDVWIARLDAPIHSVAQPDGGTGWELVRGVTWDSRRASDGESSALFGTEGGDVWLAGRASQRFGQRGAFWQKSAADGGIAWSVVGAYDGIAQLPAFPSIQGLGGSGPSNLWGVGLFGNVFRYEPSDASAGRWVGYNSQSSAALNAVAATAPDDVWAVGNDGTIRHFTNDASQRFELVESPTTRHLRSVWASSASDAWAVGDRGTVIHYDGSAWSPADIELPGESPPDLLGVSGSGPDDVWIVGEGVVLRRTKENRRHP